MDYGIVYNDYKDVKYKGNIKFCGIEENEQLVFREEIDGAPKYIIYLNSCRMKKVSICQKNIVDIKADTNGDLYYLCKKPMRIVVTKKNKKLCVKLSDEISPLSINVSNSYVFVGCANSEVVVLDKFSLNIVKQLELKAINVIEPIYINSCGEKNIIIADSLSHTVKLIDYNLNVLWQYGNDGEPGDEFDYLCVPTYAIQYYDFFIIAEQRNHRVLILSKNKEIIKQFGVSNYVGMSGEYLWAPQITLLNDWLYIIMCKGGCVYAKKYNINTSVCEHVYGQPLFKYSNLNLPRSCHYSNDNGCLIVSDTYHNRIIIYDSNGEEKSTIESTDRGNLKWPRCTLWHDSKHFYVVDSQNRRVLYMTVTGCVEKQFLLPNYLASGEWPQSIDFYDGKMMIAFQSQVAVFDKESYALLYNTIQFGIQMKDVHFACYTNEGEIIIADTGNDRLIVINDEKIQYIESLRIGKTNLPLKKPRCVSVYQNYYYIVNSGNSKIYICERKTLFVVGIYGGERGLDIDRMSMPRWITHCYKVFFAISDSDNHRIILRDLSSCELE